MSTWLRRARLTKISLMPLRSVVGLLFGHVDRDRLHGVERLRELADLVLTRDLDRRERLGRRALSSVARVAQPLTSAGSCSSASVSAAVVSCAKRRRHRSCEHRAKEPDARTAPMAMSRKVCRSFVADDLDRSTAWAARLPDVVASTCAGCRAALFMLAFHSDAPRAAGCHGSGDQPSNGPVDCNADFSMRSDRRDGRVRQCASAC